jgi:hypothetical protein
MGMRTIVALNYDLLQKLKGFVIYLRRVLEISKLDQNSILALRSEVVRSRLNRATAHRRESVEAGIGIGCESLSKVRFHGIWEIGELERLRGALNLGVFLVESHAEVTKVGDLDPEAQENREVAGVAPVGDADSIGAESLKVLVPWNRNCGNVRSVGTVRAL